MPAIANEVNMKPYPTVRLLTLAECKSPLCLLWALSESFLAF